MTLLVRLLKEKLVYAIIGLIYLVYSAKSYNEKFNADKVAAYYGSFGSPQSIGTIDNSDHSQLVKFAKEQLGKPYEVAGKGPEGFDCSGFTHFVFKRFNAFLPVSAQAQFYKGKPVKKDSVQVGDLVFFKGVDVDNNRVGHVGIVTNHSQVGIEFIHSSTSSGVMINDLLHDDYYRVRYKGARRVLGN